MNDWVDVLVYAEYIDGRLHPVTYELIGKGRELAAELGGVVKAVVICDNAREAEELIRRGAEEAYVYITAEEDEMNILLHKRVMVDLIKEVKPRIVLFGATPWGRSLAPRVAAALKSGLTADCLDIYIKDNEVIQVRPAFTGNIIAHIKTITLPAMATVRYKALKPAKATPSCSGRVIVREAKALYSEREAIKVVSKVRDKEVNIADAEVIVAGGRGIRRKEDLRMLEDLAKELGGVMAVSRPLVDIGWVSKDRQVGFSGNIVRPRVYIACGISGSPQHLAGMKDSKRIISINIDPSAPIRKFSDLFIIGDLYDIIPKLLDEVRKVKKQKRGH